MPNRETLSNRWRTLTGCICTFFIVLFSNSVYSQELSWAFSNGGHLTERAWNVEKVPGGVVFLSSDGLEKRSETGEQLWRFDFFELDAYQYNQRPTLRTFTVDEAGNIYAQLTFPANGPGPTTIANIDLPHGDSLIKINANGELLWCRKLTGSTSPKLAYHNGTVFVLGVFNQTINIADSYIFENRENSDCSLNSSENQYARDIFIAKFNTIGQVQDAVSFGGLAHDDLKALTIDDEGNLYLAINYGFSSCTIDETQIHKVDPNLQTIWSKKISKEYIEGNGYNVLLPSNIHLGANGKLYIWAYAFDTVISDDYRFVKTRPYGYTAGLLEYNGLDGSFLNYRSFDGFTGGIRGGYMADYKGHLFLATSFWNDQEFDNGSLSTSSEGEEPILLKVALNNLSMEYLLHPTGVPQQYHTQVKDWSGPIQIKGDALYYSGSFSSDTLNLSQNIALYNNSGNNAQDYFLSKYDLDAISFSTSDEDDDKDGVDNVMDLCPDTLAGESVDEHGCSPAQNDSDVDGVTDNNDLCPDTPLGSQANVDGCSEAQQDADSDGVPDFKDSCANTVDGVVVNEEGCEIVSLDSELFKVETIGEACEGLANGRIDIVTEDTSKVYRAILNGGQEIAFTGHTQFVDLSAGQYELCLLADEMDSDMLCYTLTITQAEDIDLDGKVDLSTRTLKIDLSGGTNYTVIFNGQLFETQETSIVLEMKHGSNEVQVTTEHLCQGTAFFKIDLDARLRVAPNPFIDAIDLSHMHGDAPVEVFIYNQNGQEVYHKEFGQGEPKVLRNLTGLATGIYLLEYKEDQTRYFQKIAKK